MCTECLVSTGNACITGLSHMNLRASLFCFRSSVAIARHCLSVLQLPLPLSCRTYFTCCVFATHSSRSHVDEPSSASVWNDIDTEHTSPAVPTPSQEAKIQSPLLSTRTAGSAWYHRMSSVSPATGEATNQTTPTVFR